MVLIWLVNSLEENLVSLAFTQTKKAQAATLSIRSFFTKMWKEYSYTLQLVWWSQLKSNYFHAADSFRFWSLLIFTRNFPKFIEFETSLQFPHQPLVYLQIHTNIIHSFVMSSIFGLLQNTVNIWTHFTYILWTVHRETYTWEWPTSFTLFITNLFQLNYPLLVSNK